MANHPNRGWRSRWSVDVKNGTASHKDGWMFKFDSVGKEFAYYCAGKPVELTEKLEAKFGRVMDEALIIYRERQAGK